MIIEHAIFRIRPGQEAAFEKAFPNAVPHIASSDGFIGLELRRCVENPSSYHLLARWRSVDDHMIGFRESERFKKWREVIGPFFAQAPEVVHLEAPVVTG